MNYSTYRQSEKKLLSSSISSRSARNMANFGPLTAETCWRVWGTPASFSRFRVLDSLPQRRRSTEANQTARCLAVSWAATLYMHFRGFCSVTEFCQRENSLCAQVLRYPILAALLHGTPAAVISQTLWRGTNNGITDLPQTAPPLFGWAAITLGVGPHSSL